MFDGKYHGHGDATMVVLEDGEVVPEYDGLPSALAGQARVAGFNDVDALERALAPRDVALVLAEPAMTNAGFPSRWKGSTSRCGGSRGNGGSKWLGPTVSVAHTEADVERYVGVFAEFLAAVT